MTVDHSFWLSEEGLKKADMFLFDGDKRHGCHSFVMAERTKIGEQFVLDNPDAREVNLTQAIGRAKALGLEPDIPRFLQTLYAGDGCSPNAADRISELTAANLGLLFLWDYFDARWDICLSGFSGLNTTVVRKLIANVQDPEALSKPPAMLKRLVHDVNKKKPNSSLQLEWDLALRRVVCANIQQKLPELYAVLYTQSYEVDRHSLPEPPMLLTDDNKYAVTARRYGVVDCISLG